jgi:pyruvate-formate lyase-activating enzyme
MNKPIYVPSGKAKEYGDYALNIYTGCPHHCWYCYAPSVLHIDRKSFHTDVRPRDGIVEAVEKQLAKGGIKDKLIHLCFACDPYPRGHDTTVTREIIQLIKGSGNHVQILTKGAGLRDIDLLDENDWYGVSITGEEPDLAIAMLMKGVVLAKKSAIKTWCSYEPVLNPAVILRRLYYWSVIFDKVKIGKLNHHPSTIDWKAFGEEAERLCIELGLDYYIKDSLRAEMEKQP